MGHLTDMEELVASVRSENIRNYMQEALSCYMAGAYRAAVVLTFIALFDDIVAKLGELGKVNKKAKLIHVEATKRRSEQDVYETYLIDQLKSNNLLASLDATFLETLRTLRNKAAHPSGHHASAEEARFVFFEAISRFLSKPILSTTQFADQILASMSDENLFPSKFIQDISLVVKKDVSHLHSSVFPYLVMKLVEKARDNDSSVAMNSRFFLSGLAKIGDPAAIVALRKHGIVDLASSKADNLTVLTLLSSNGSLFSELDAVSYQRITVLFGERVEKVTSTLPHNSFSHPVSVLLSLCSANETDVVIAKLGDKFDLFIETFCYSAKFTKDALPNAGLRGPLLDALFRRAGSGDFYVANAFVKHSVDLDAIAGADLTGEECLRLVLNVIKAAHIGAFSAVDMRNSKFGALPVLRANALAFIAQEAALADAVAKEVLGGYYANDSLQWLNE